MIDLDQLKVALMAAFIVQREQNESSWLASLPHEVAEQHRKHTVKDARDFAEKRTAWALEIFGPTL